MGGAGASAPEGIEAVTDDDADEPFAGGLSAAPTPAPVPGLLCDIHALTAAPEAAAAGAMWKLAESGRQLDANVVHLRPGRRVGTHTEPDLDVLLLVVSGGGVLT